MHVFLISMGLSNKHGQEQKKNALDIFYIQYDLSRHRIATASGTDKRMTRVRRQSICYTSLSFFIHCAVISLS